MAVAKIVNVGSFTMLFCTYFCLPSLGARKFNEFHEFCPYLLISVLRYSALHDVKTQYKTTVSTAGIKTTSTLILWMWLIGLHAFLPQARKYTLK